MLHSTRMWWLMFQPAESRTGIWELISYETENDAIKAMARLLQNGAKVRSLRHGDEVVLDAKDIAKCYHPVRDQAA